MMEKLIEISVALLLTGSGFAVWTAAALSMEKDKYDDEEKDFPLASYWKKNWDNILFTGLVAILLLVIGLSGISLTGLPVEDELGDVTESWHPIYYIVSGPFGEWLLRLFKKLAKLRT